MRYLIFIILFISATSCNGQKEKTKGFSFEKFDKQILEYSPVKNNYINKNTFDEGIKFLEETKNRIKKNNNLDVADYWNILTVFSNLNESNENIDIAFKKFINAESSCEYLISFEMYFDNYNAYLQSKMTKQLEICNNSNQFKDNESINIEEYAKINGLDKNLVEIINQIGISDQNDRYNEELQNELDIKNQIKIDSLFVKYQTYLGKTLTGNKFKNVMWQVIQHSKLDYMEKYLPIVITAVKNNELGESALKYLIDRIYSEKYNFQIFGSQGNVKMADELIRIEVKSKYKL